MFNPEIKRIGLFKDAGSYTIYVSDFFWKDFQPLIVFETAIKINNLSVGKGLNSSVYIAGHSCIDCIVDYKWINDRIVENGLYPDEYEIVLQNGVIISGGFFATTFIVPEKCIIEFIYKLIPFTPQNSVGNLLGILTARPDEMLYIDRNNGIKYEKVENLYSYFERLENETQEYFANQTSDQ